MKQKTKRHHQKRKKRIGGTQLAYPYKGTYLSNPALAYNIRGGNHNYSRMYPAHGPHMKEFNFLNPLQTQNGGVGVGVGVGSSYPNGLVGHPYNNPTNLPGVNGISGEANYYINNKNPIITLENVNANAPFLKGGGGRKSKKRQKGGAFSNSFGQELLNLGRNVPFAFSSAYNGLFGYAPPINPSPTIGQFVKPVKY